MGRFFFKLAQINNPNYENNNSTNSYYQHIK